MNYTALVPVKTLTAAKSRLAEHLTLDQRESLVLDMLHHVLQTLRESELLEQISVVSADERVLEQARAWDARPLPEEEHGHNPALQAAALKDLAAAHAQDLPLQGLLTISADLPLLSTSDIHALIERSERYQVVLAPSCDGTGTNAILMRPPLVLPYLFGPGSLQRYLRAAWQQKLSSTIYSSTGLAFDVDTIDDLRELKEIIYGYCYEYII